MKSIALFDMDGTLTEARKEMQEDMLESLVSLSSFCDIGIVTGSNLKYVRQQCKILLENIGKLHSTLTLYPCNGTQVYKISSQEQIKCA